MNIRNAEGIVYALERKRVKNINLRVNADGEVRVSAPYYVSSDKVDEFVASRSEFIENARLRAFEARRVSDGIREYMKGFSDEQYQRFFKSLIDKYYPMFEPYGIKYPTLKVRDMKSRWGSCMPSKGVITLNKLLAAVPIECAEYVTVHELCHFFELNHSRKFYAWVEQFMPDWRARRNRLKEYVLY